MAYVITVLSQNVHPLVLGSVFRARAHIRMLAKSLLEKHMGNINKNNARIEKIVRFLCSDSGSHDYTINRNQCNAVFQKNKN